jgi:hypothetical protein
MDNTQTIETVQQINTTTAAILSNSSEVERANIDMQVATAHKYPRDLMRVTNNAVAIATMDEETARACGYALPRGGKPITGPSVHLAKILAQQYGNLRVEAKVVQITDKQIISRGTAWDLESNNAYCFEVRRSILYATGKRYNDDMITVTGNAANSIAFRNAVFAIVPKAITDKVYNATRHMLIGDLSDEEKLIKRRTDAIQHFKDMYNISEEDVIKLCGKQTVNQIRANEIGLLIGIAQSLRDGDTTVDDLLATINPKKRNKKTTPVENFDEETTDYEEVNS